MEVSISDYIKGRNVNQKRLVHLKNKLEKSLYHLNVRKTKNVEVKITMSAKYQTELVYISNNADADVTGSMLYEIAEKVLDTLNDYGCDDVSFDEINLSGDYKNIRVHFSL